MENGRSRQAVRSPAQPSVFPRFRFVRTASERGGAAPCSRSTAGRCPFDAPVGHCLLMRRTDVPGGRSRTLPPSSATTDRVCRRSSPCSCAVVGVVRKARRYGFFLYFGISRRPSGGRFRTLFPSSRPRTAYVSAPLPVPAQSSVSSEKRGGTASFYTSE